MIRVISLDSTHLCDSSPIMGKKAKFLFHPGNEDWMSMPLGCFIHNENMMNKYMDFNFQNFHHPENFNLYKDKGLLDLSFNSSLKQLGYDNKFICQDPSEYYVNFTMVHHNFKVGLKRITENNLNVVRFPKMDKTTSTVLPQVGNSITQTETIKQTNVSTETETFTKNEETVLAESNKANNESESEIKLTESSNYEPTSEDTEDEQLSNSKANKPKNFKFVIKGLPDNTPPENIITELQSYNLTISKIIKMTNRPIFIGIISITEDLNKLKEIKKLQNQEIIIEKYDRKLFRKTHWKTTPRLNSDGESEEDFVNLPPRKKIRAQPPTSEQATPWIKSVDQTASSSNQLMELIIAGLRLLLKDRAD